MKNLDQIRAKNALEAAHNKRFKGINDGDVVKKVPAMIQQNGLLGALAFAIDKEKGYKDVLDACIEHYASPATLRRGQNTPVPREAARRFRPRPGSLRCQAACAP